MDTTHTTGLAAARRGLLCAALALGYALAGCSSMHLGNPVGSIERTRTDGLQGVIAERTERIDARDRKAIAEVLLAAEREHKLDPLLLVALIEHESRWDADAVSSHRALGLMQVKAPVAQPIARALDIDFDPAKTLFDPVANVRIGTAYFAEMMERFGVVELALTAYNIGPNRTAQILAVGDEPPKGFARAVLGRYAKIRAAAPANTIRTAGL